MEREITRLNPDGLSNANAVRGGEIWLELWSDNVTGPSEPVMFVMTPKQAVDLIMKLSSAAKRAIEMTPK